MPSELHVTVPGASDILRVTDTIRVGRADSNGIVLAYETVSGEHLELRPTADGWEIVDLGSTNGTFVNGVLVTRAPLGARTAVRLGKTGPELRLSIPGKGRPGGTQEVTKDKLIERYLSDEQPEHMSRHTGMLRAALQERRELEANDWLKRLRKWRVAVLALVAVTAAAGGMAVWQARRADELRTAAGSVFNTMKALELDVRRLQATTGPDSAIQERQARLEAQYEDLVKTLGIYSKSTPPDVQLIYRTIHRLGESEANVPRGFVDEVRKYIKRWNPEDLQAGFARARSLGLGPSVAEILLAHHLPREFFYLALQESKLDPKAVGPSTRLGVPKGLWQLIPPTAEAYGLKLGPQQGERTYDPSDERHDVQKATAAAARYLEDIYTTDAQASGLLVMASYNMGETRIRRLIRSMPESPAQRNFWALLARHRAEIPAETYDYVFRVVSAAVIGANPHLFGFDFDPLPGAGPDAPALPEGRAAN